MKILIAMLGLGDRKPRKDNPNRIGGYGEETYTIAWTDPPLERRLEYHQPLLAEALGAEQLWIVCTDEAGEAHLESLCAAHPVDRVVHIPKGVEPTEFWEMFEGILTALEALETDSEEVSEPHELHLDLTHGFRVQPVFLLEAVRYLCELHSDRFRLAGIHYNFFEEKGQPAPLIPVTPILEMATVASEIQQFLRYGVAEPLAARLEQVAKAKREEIIAEARAAGRKPTKSDFAAPVLSELDGLSRQLRSFGGVARMNLSPVAAPVTRNLLELARESKEAFTGSLAPLGRALARLGEELERLLPTEKHAIWAWHLALARWALERSLTQQALTHANELTTTRMCEEQGLDPFDLETRKREGRKLSQYFQGKLRPPEIWAELVRALEKVNGDRNEVNHAYMQKVRAQMKAKDVLNIGDKLRKDIEEVLAIHGSFGELPDPALLDRGRET